VLYADALARLYRLQSRGIRLGASRMAAALAYRGHPERGQVFVHVAGTNGKGSVSAMSAACLRAAGYRTGLFTSPHMQRWVERIRIDGRPLGEREAARRITELLDDFERNGAPDTTFFELTTLLALEVFRDHRCEVSVLEVGLGGRLDATNAVKPAVSVITNIALDHTRVLGHTIAAIAAEKAGIVKRAVPLVVGTRDPWAREVIAARARRVRADAAWIDRDFAVSSSGRPGGFDLRVGSRRIAGLRSGLLGAHQRDNAACAVAALLRLDRAGLRVSEAALRKGLAAVRWPGRLERVSGRPSFLLDAAHNLDGCRTLVQYLDQTATVLAARGGRRVLIFGAMADKQYARMLRLLAPRVRRIYFSPPAIGRAASFAQLSRVVRGTRTRGIGDAIARARRAAGPDGEVVITGSIYLLADARAKVLGVRSDPPIRM
jgi:dihydrofolate synthase / folylpolyglutamate synthase